MTSTLVLFRYFTSLADTPIPWISPWPHPYALGSHPHPRRRRAYPDTKAFPCSAISSARHGYRSSWNFVPMRYAVDEQLISRSLTESGFEVGVHGLYHDGRDFASERIFTERLSEVARYAELWNARGFRSPSTHRVWDVDAPARLRLRLFLSRTLIRSSRIREAAAVLLPYFNRRVWSNCRSPFPKTTRCSRSSAIPTSRCGFEKMLATSNSKGLWPC